MENMVVGVRFGSIWVTLASSGTNLGLFHIRFQLNTPWLSKPKYNEIRSENFPDLL